MSNKFSISKVIKCTSKSNLDLFLLYISGNEITSKMVDYTAHHQVYTTWASFMRTAC